MSCVDYIQSISYKGGKYHLYYKVTFSKILMELAEEDVDDFMKDFNEEFVEPMPDFFSANPVNTELEVGVEFSFDIDPKNATDEEKDVLPKKAGNKYLIPFSFSNELSQADDFDSLDAESESIAMAMLSTAKFRILIAKNIIPTIETAYFKGTGKKDFSIPFFDFGDSYCLEIPYIVFFERTMYNFNEIVIIPHG